MLGWLILVVLLMAVFWPLAHPEKFKPGQYMGDSFDDWNHWA